jgi:protocatechuate 3,4-dioxygenase, beta subunit
MRIGLLESLNRREFLGTVSIGLAALPLARFGLGHAAAQANTPEQSLADFRANATWKTVMVSPEEPGEPMVVGGTICGADGRTPLEGARLYVYHTDAQGYYSRPMNDPHRPRIRGWMKTAADGRYEFRTIKPAPYPGRHIPAHIHGTVAAPGYPARWLAEYWFEGDPFLTPEQIAESAGKGRFSAILKLQKGAADVLRGVRDIQLTRS